MTGMKIAVTGPRGRLGQELVRHGCHPISVDVTDLEALQTAIAVVRPEIIIHCAALTDVDDCERVPLETLRVNIGGGINLARAFPGKIVYLSTDYIFDGEHGPYRESARPGPINVYGWSKLGGEMILKDHPHLIVRTTILFDRYSDNFMIRIIQRLRSEQMIVLPDRLFGSPTYIPHLVEGILAAIQSNLEGIINLAGPKVFSRYEFGKSIARAIGADPNLIRPGPIIGLARRPSRAGLILDRARELGLPIHDPIDGLKEMIDAMEKVAAG